MTIKPQKQPLLAVVGPTASGKTDLGLQIARERHGEIISFDSRQVYRFLSVGTAKPAGSWQDAVYLVNGIPYHLVDVWPPDQAFTAADFIRLARAAIASVHSRGKMPILVGGTGLYLKALTEGLAALPPGDEGLRAELKAFAVEKGRAALHAELAKVDARAAAEIPPNNIHRVMRALEVHRLTGKPISLWHREHQDRLRQEGERLPLDIIEVALSPQQLKERIEKRCAAMLANGMIEETKALLEKGFAADCPALTGLGYPRVIAHIRGELSKTQLLDLLIRDTRRYAKRQLTWFKNQLKEHPAGRRAVRGGAV